MYYTLELNNQKEEMSERNCRSSGLAQVPHASKIAEKLNKNHKLHETRSKRPNKLSIDSASTQSELVHLHSISLHNSSIKSPPAASDHLPARPEKQMPHHRMAPAPSTYVCPSDILFRMDRRYQGATSRNDLVVTAQSDQKQ